MYFNNFPLKSFNSIKNLFDIYEKYARQNKWSQAFKIMLTLTLVQK
jgi:hypothetical protein